MDPAFKAQLDIKNSTEEWQKYVREMKSWEEEIKLAEQKLRESKADNEKILPLPRNVAKKRQQPQKATSPVVKRIPMYDYGAWDKFDVDKACKDTCGASDSDDSGNSDNDDEPDLPPVTKKVPEAKTSEKVKAKPKAESLSPEEEAKFNEAVKDSIASAENIDGQSKIDQAFFEKELGNAFVSKGKWQDAINCYTKSIKLDPTNAVYHANRALCYLKLKQLKAAETDCTIAIQLDKSYVKAYQRRGYARKALLQYNEAKSDFEQVLLLDPKNSAAKVEVESITEYLNKTATQSLPGFDPKKMFENKPTAKVSKEKKVKVDAKSSSSEEKKVVSREELKIISNSNIEKPPDGTHTKNKSNIEIPYEFTTKLPEECTVIQPISKPPHLRSKVPLSRINVIQTTESKTLDDWISDYSRDHLTIVKVKKPEAVQSSPKIEPVRIPTPSLDTTSPKCELPPIPKTYVQFANSWEEIRRNDDLVYEFLKAIPNLPQMFGSGLESPMLSSLLSSLSRGSCLKDSAFLHTFLLALTKVERFTSLVMFMEPADVKATEKCLSALKELISQEEMTNLRNLFDLL